MKRLAVLILLLFCVVCLQSYTKENPWFRITEADVALKIPEGFPRPVYDFKQNQLTPGVFTLGRRLFYDPILSRDSSTSCASCHQRFAAFAHTDHQLSHGINGLIGKRNVPAIQNMIWQTSFMWDGGVNHIEIQPVSPMTDATEMGNTLKAIVEKLRSREGYRDQFRSVYGDTLISSERILKALAQFTGLMISADARYDRYLKGTDTFSVAEKKGLALFSRHCASCHKPPLFTDQSFRNNGLALDTALNDTGRAGITHQPADYMKFKVPSLRNLVMTYPYMHDGRFRNLNAVLDHYRHPAGNKGKTDPLISKGILFSDEDKLALISFLKTLTDKTFLYDKRFAEPVMLQ